MRDRSLRLTLLALLLTQLALLAELAFPALALPARPARTGGGRRALPDRARSPHLVVDALNLTHWLYPGQTPTPELVAEAIDSTADLLRLRHPGQVVYVAKDRETVLGDAAAAAVYQAAATRNRVLVALAGRYADPPASEAGKAGKADKIAQHAARGRDDFFLALLARRLRCAVLTEDRLRDFEAFRAAIPPFQVTTFTFWSALPQREQVLPTAAAFARLARPRMVRYAEYGLCSAQKEAHSCTS